MAYGELDQTTSDLLRLFKAAFIWHLFGTPGSRSPQRSFSAVIAAIIVGSSVVVSASTELMLFDIRVQYFGIAGYLIAGVLGLGLTWAIFRSGRLH